MMRISSRLQYVFNRGRSISARSTKDHIVVMSAVGRKHFKVAIIGAGFAGLSAARTLQQQGDLSPHHDFIVLEASSRAGGRAYTIPSIHQTLNIELGATWIHGIGTPEDPNPILETAINLGILNKLPKRQRWWDSTYCLASTARALTREERLVLHKTIEAYAAAIDSIDSTVHETTCHALSAAWEFFIENDDMIKHCDDFMNIAVAAWHWRDQLQRAIDGADPHDMHPEARAMYSEYGNSEVHASIPGSGYQSIAQGMARGVNVVYRHKVEKIEIVSRIDGNINHNDGDRSITNPAVLLRCENGAEFTSDAVIVTIPLGVLQKQHTKVFKPQLPDHIATALSRLKSGVVDKLILDFAYHDGDGDPSHKEQEIEDHNTSSEADYLPSDQGVSSYALLWKHNKNVQNDTYCDDTINGDEMPEWTQGIFSIRFGGPEFKRKQEQNNMNDSDITTRAPCSSSEEDDDVYMQEKNKPPKYSQAVIWLTGDHALHAESLSDEEIIQGIRAVIQKYPSVVLPHSLQGMQGKTSDAGFIDWSKVMLYRSRWGQDPLFHGSYSYVGKDSCIEDVLALQQGIEMQGKVIIAFAGEATTVEYIVRCRDNLGFVFLHCDVHDMLSFCLDSQNIHLKLSSFSN